MKNLKIVTFPDPSLRSNCSSLERVSKEDAELLEDMVYTMKNSGGIGLAGPQVGILKKMIVASDGKNRIIKLVNPQIIAQKGFTVMAEGCLSLPNEVVEVERFYKVIVKGINENNKLSKIKAKGLLARVLQHEIDHLSGKLIIDYRR
ncbi:MAG: peptide deformylase [Candidatus Omnitrophica bacterium]|nr:peptide deformylase [Candidatus Omnitrophota bacterium]